MAYKRTSYKKASRKGRRRRRVSSKKRTMRRSRKPSAMKRWKNKTVRFKNTPVRSLPNNYLTQVVNLDPIAIQHAFTYNQQPPAAPVIANRQQLFTVNLAQCIVSNTLVSQNVSNYTYFRIKRVDILMVPSRVLSGNKAGPAGFGLFASTAAATDPDTLVAGQWGRHAFILDYNIDRGTIDSIKAIKAGSNFVSKNHNKSIKCTYHPKVWKQASTTPASATLPIQPIAAPWMTTELASGSHEVEHVGCTYFSEGNQDQNVPMLYRRYYMLYGGTTAPQGVVAQGAWAGYTAYQRVYIEWKGLNPNSV